MGGLKKLLSLCACGVYLTVNEHRDVYETVEQELEDNDTSECPTEIPDDLRKKMIETDTVIKLQFYPKTPCGHYVLWHYDLDTIIQQAIDILTDDFGMKKE